MFISKSSRSNYKVFRKRLEKYAETLQYAHLYPDTVILPLQQLVIEYSLDVARIRKYMNLKRKVKYII